MSKSGLTASAGVRGERVTLGPPGVRRTVGIHGTGISYSENNAISGSSKRTRRSSSLRPTDDEAHEEVSSAHGRLMIIVAIVIFAIFAAIGSR